MGLSPTKDAGGIPEKKTSFITILFKLYKIFKLTQLCTIMQLSVVSRLKNEHLLALIGYCLESRNRILVYEHANLGSLHDVLHGRLYKLRSCNHLMIMECLNSDEGLFNLCGWMQEGKVCRGPNQVQF